MLVGLAAAIGAFGAAVMTSAATAQTARADDFTDIIANVDTDLAAGQSEFGFAATDLGSGHLVSGTSELLAALDDDLVSAPYSVVLGSVDAVTNQPIAGFDPVLVIAPPSFADALTYVAEDFGVAQTYASEALTALAGGEYATAVSDDLYGSLWAAVFPDETLLLGGMVSLGL